MQPNDALKMLQGLGVIRRYGHYVYASGKHGSAYLNKDALYPHTVETAELCGAIAEKFAKAGVQAVVGPAVGGVILSQWTANHLYYMTFKEVLSCYAEKTADGGMALSRGYDKLVAGKRVLIVEDVLTTGGSARKVVDAVRAAGGDVVAVAAICNRGGVKSDGVGGVPLLALLDFDLPTWDAEECHLCKGGVEVDTEFGHGKKFIESKK